jgi:Fe-S-cluster-containing hydrogenase component 2
MHGKANFCYIGEMVPASNKKSLILSREKCISCAGCVGVCPHMALDMYEIELQVFQEKCTYCKICIRFCPVGAFSVEET